MHKGKADWREFKHDDVEPTADELAALLRAMVLGGTDDRGQLQAQVMEPGGFVGLVANVRRAIAWLKVQKNQAERTQRIVALMKANRLAIRFGPDDSPHVAGEKAMHILEVPEEDD